MKELMLTNGTVVKVDDADYDMLNMYSWSMAKSKKLYYAVRTIRYQDGKRKIVLMHRLIMDTPHGMDCDHKDGDGLNNQRDNLRNCTRSQNSQNKVVSCKTRSGYKGISLDHKRNKWLARIKVGERTLFLGYHDDPIQAALAYNEAALEHFGEYAKINVIDATEVCSNGKD